MTLPSALSQFVDWVADLFDTNSIGACPQCGETRPTNVRCYGESVFVACDECFSHLQFVAERQYPPHEYWEQVRQDGDLDNWSESR